MEAGAAMVQSALVQEGVTRAVSFVLGKRKERPSQGHMMERLEMAVNEVESVVVRTAKMPITVRALINRRKMLKQAYTEGADLLSRHHKHQQAAAALALQNDDQAAATFSSLARRWVKKKVSSVSSLFGWNKSSDDLSLSCDDIGRYEWFADSARNFLRDLESGCTLYHYTFSNPLVRYLLEGKTLTYEFVRGHEERRLHIHAVLLEDRGVVADLGYKYLDHGRHEKSFELEFTVQLSESTDIVGVGIRCLQAFTFLDTNDDFIGTALGELRLLANLKAICRTYAHMPARVQELVSKNIEFLRPDPACCTTNNHGYRSVPFPDHQVLYYRVVSFKRKLLSDSSSSSADEASTSLVRRPPKVYYDIRTLIFMPHCEGLTEGVVVEVLGTEQTHRYESMQKIERLKLPAALDQFINVQQSITGWKAGWSFQHGCVTLEIETPAIQTARKPNGSQCNLMDSKAKGKALQQQPPPPPPPPQEEEEEETSLPLAFWLATEKQLARLRLACKRLYCWYMERRERMPITVRYKAEHFLSEPGFFRVEIDDLSNLLELHALGVGLIRCWTLYMMAKHINDPFGFLDPQLVCEDNIRCDASKVEEYVTKAMLHHQDKIYIFAPYNFQSHWILIVILLEDSAVVYLDSMNNSPEYYRLVIDIIDRSFAMYISNKGEDTPRQTTMKHYFKYTWHEQPENGINTSGYYVCHHIQEVILAAEIERGMKIPTGQLLTSELAYIQGLLADFLLLSVINKDGEFHDPGANY